MFDVKPSTTALTQNSRSGESLVSEIPWHTLKPGLSIFIPFDVFKNHYNNEKEMYANLRPAASRKGKRYGYVFKVAYDAVNKIIEIGCTAEAAGGVKAKIRQTKTTIIKEDRTDRYNRAKLKIESKNPNTHAYGTPEYWDISDKNDIGIAHLFNEYESKFEEPQLIDINLTLERQAGRKAALAGTQSSEPNQNLGFDGKPIQSTPLSWLNTKMVFEVDKRDDEDE